MIYSSKEHKLEELFTAMRNGQPVQLDMWFVAVVPPLMKTMGDMVHLEKGWRNVSKFIKEYQEWVAFTKPY